MALETLGPTLKPVIIIYRPSCKVTLYIYFNIIGPYIRLLQSFVYMYLCMFDWNELLLVDLRLSGDFDSAGA